MASDTPFFDAIVVMLTGMHIPNAKAALIELKVEQPNAELAAGLAELQQEIAKVAQSVEGSVSGQWNDAYVGAMKTFSSGDGGNAIENLRLTALAMADFGREAAYQVDYTNRMIIAQVLEFLIEWMITLILAIFNPVAAEVEQTFLQELYGMIMKNVILRLLATLAQHQALNIGLGAAMDILVRWSLARDGKTTNNGSQLLKQALGFGAVQGALSPFVPFLGGLFAKGIGKGLGRNTAKDLLKALDDGLPGPGPGGKNLTRDISKDAGPGGGPGPKEDLGGGKGPGVPGRGVGLDGPAGPGGAAFPNGAAGSAGSGFTRDLAQITGGMVDHISLRGGLTDATVRSFRDDVGSLFARDLAGGADPELARAAGMNWANTLISHLGRKDLGQALNASLHGLPQSVGAEVRNVLSHGVAQILTPDFGRKFAFHAGMGLAEGVHQNAAEAAYTLFTTGRIGTSFETFISGVVGGRLSHGLSASAELMGSGIRNHLPDIKNLFSRPPAYTPDDLNPPPSYDNTTGALPTTSSDGTGNGHLPPPDIKEQPSTYVPGDAGPAHPLSTVNVPTVDSPALDNVPPPHLPRLDLPSEHLSTVSTPGVHVPTFDAADANSRAVDTPAIDTPAIDTPAIDTPAGNTPAGNTPAIDTPVGNTPAGDTPADRPAAEDGPTRNGPTENGPAGSVSGQNTDPGFLPPQNQPPVSQSGTPTQNTLTQNTPTQNTPTRTQTPGNPTPGNPTSANGSGRNQLREDQPAQSEVGENSPPRHISTQEDLPAAESAPDVRTTTDVTTVPDVAATADVRAGSDQPPHLPTTSAPHPPALNTQYEAPGSAPHTRGVIPPAAHTPNTTSPPSEFAPDVFLPPSDIITSAGTRVEAAIPAERHFGGSGDDTSVTHQPGRPGDPAQRNEHLDHGLTRPSSTADDTTAVLMGVPQPPRAAPMPTPSREARDAVPPSPTDVTSDVDETSTVVGDDETLMNADGTAIDVNAALRPPTIGNGPADTHTSTGDFHAPPNAAPVTTTGSRPDITVPPVGVNDAGSMTTRVSPPPPGSAFGLPDPDRVRSLDPGEHSELVAGVNRELHRLGRPDVWADEDDVNAYYERLPAHQLTGQLTARAHYIAGAMSNNGDPLRMPGGAPEMLGNNAPAHTVPAAATAGRSRRPLPQPPDPTKLNSAELTAYARVEPSLSGYVQRESVTDLELEDPRRIFLLQRNSDGTLPQRAHDILIAERAQSHAVNLEWIQDHENVGFFVDDGLSDAQLRSMLTDENRRNYPELESYLRRADPNTTADFNPPTLTAQNVSIGPTNIRIHYDRTDPRHAVRIKHVTDAVGRVLHAGFTVPDFEVDLPRYTRPIHVALDGTITVGEGLGFLGEFYAPNRLVVAPHVGTGARDRRDGDGVFTNLDMQFDDMAAAVITHEIGHFLQFDQNATKLWDLTRTTFHPDFQQDALAVSSYAVSPPEYTAEHFLGLVYGKRFTQRQWQLYRVLGGALPDPSKARRNDRPEPTDRELDDLTTNVNLQLQERRLAIVHENRVIEAYRELPRDLKFAYQRLTAAGIADLIQFGQIQRMRGGAVDALVQSESDPAPALSSAGPESTSTLTDQSGPIDTTSTPVDMPPEDVANEPEALEAWDLMPAHAAPQPDTSTVVGPEDIPALAPSESLRTDEPEDWHAYLDRTAEFSPGSKVSENAPATRSDAWNRYLEAYEKHEFALIKQETNATQTADVDSARIQRTFAEADLKRWGLSNPAELIQEYRSRTNVHTNTNTDTNTNTVADSRTAEASDETGDTSLDAPAAPLAPGSSPSAAAERQYAQLIHRLLMGDPVDSAALQVVLQRRVSTPALFTPTTLLNAFQEVAQRSLTVALNDAVTSGRLPVEQVREVWRGIGLISDFTYADESLDHLAAAPDRKLSELPQVQSFITDLRTSSTGEEAVSKLDSLGRDMRRIWAVEDAWRTRYGTEPRQELSTQWPEYTASFARALGATDGSTPVPMDQVASWYQQLSDVTFEHPVHQTVPVTADHPEAGCTTRAHLWGLQLMRWGTMPLKVAAAWADGVGLRVWSTTGHGATDATPVNISWEYHIAPVVVAQRPGEMPVHMVLDPALRRGPLTIPEWATAVGLPNNYRFERGRLAQIHERMVDDYKANPEGWKHPEFALPRTPTLVLTEGFLVGFPHPDTEPTTSWQEADDVIRPAQDQLYRHYVRASRRNLARGLWNVLNEVRDDEPAAVLDRLSVVVTAHLPAPGFLSTYGHIREVVSAYLGDDYQRFEALFPEAEDEADHPDWSSAEASSVSDGAVDDFMMDDDEDGYAENEDSDADILADDDDSDADILDDDEDSAADGQSPAAEDVEAPASWRSIAPAEAPRTIPPDAAPPIARASDPFVELRQLAVPALVNTTHFDPSFRGRLDNGRLDGSESVIRFDARRFQLADGDWVSDATVRLHLTLQGTGISDRDARSLAARLTTAVRQDINEASFRLPNGDLLHLNLEFHSQPENVHHQVTLHAGQGVTTTRDWYLQSPDGIQLTVHQLVHELAHMVMGLPDRYVDDNRVFRRTRPVDRGPGAVRDNGSIMAGEPRDGSPMLSKEDLAGIGNLFASGPVVRDLPHPLARLRPQSGPGRVGPDTGVAPAVADQVEPKGSHDSGELGDGERHVPAGVKVSAKLTSLPPDIVRKATGIVQAYNHFPPTMDRGPAVDAARDERNDAVYRVVQALLDGDRRRAIAIARDIARRRGIPVPAEGSPMTHVSYGAAPDPDEAPHTSDVGASLLSPPSSVASTSGTTPVPVASTSGAPPVPVPATMTPAQPPASTPASMTSLTPAPNLTEDQLKEWWAWLHANSTITRDIAQRPAGIQGSATMAWIEYREAFEGHERVSSHPKSEPEFLLKAAKFRLNRAESGMKYWGHADPAAVMIRYRALANPDLAMPALGREGDNSAALQPPVRMPVVTDFLDSEPNEVLSAPEVASTSGTTIGPGVVPETRAPAGPPTSIMTPDPVSTTSLTPAVDGARQQRWLGWLDQNATGAPTKPPSGAPTRKLAWEQFLSAHRDYQAVRAPGARPAGRFLSGSTQMALEKATANMQQWGHANPDGLISLYDTMMKADPAANPADGIESGDTGALAPPTQPAEPVVPPVPPTFPEPVVPPVPPKFPEPVVPPALLDPPSDPPSEPPSVPQLPFRIGDQLILGGIDVVETFESGNAAYARVKDLVTREGGQGAWERNREKARALFSDDALRPRSPGMLRGGRPVNHVVNFGLGRKLDLEIGFGRVLSIDLRLLGAPDSSLKYHDEIKKYEFEHTSEPTSTVAENSDGRWQGLLGVQANVAHENVGDTLALVGSREHQWALNNQRADRQVSGAQTTEPATRFGGTIRAEITHHFSDDAKDRVHEPHVVEFKTMVAVPTRDVVAKEEAEELLDTLGPLPSSDPSRTPVPVADRPSDGPPRVRESHALSGSDVVTNLRLIPDEDPTPGQQPPPAGVPSLRGPSRRDVASLFTGDPMGNAFSTTFGKQSVRAMAESRNWLTVELLQANLHTMTNKQPLVLNMESVPGGRMEVHAFIEPLGTPVARPPVPTAGGTGKAAEGMPSDARAGRRMLRATGETGDTEFHFGSETDTSEVRQDVVTQSVQLPVPGRLRGQGGTDTGQVWGGLDGTAQFGHTLNHTRNRQYRLRNTLKLPVPGQAWHGQVRLRFELHAPGAKAPQRLGGPVRSAVVESRARFDVLMEKSETTLPDTYKGKEVWAPPKRVWGAGPVGERRSVSSAPWWRPGAHHRTVLGAAPASASRPSPQDAADAPLRLLGLGSMDRVTNLDLSGTHSLLDVAGRRAFGSDWTKARQSVMSWFQLTRLRASLPAMTQHSPLTRAHLSGAPSSAKVSMTADIEQLTYRRVIVPLASPSTEVTEGVAVSDTWNRQLSQQGALGGRGDVAGGTIGGEAIGGANHTARRGDRQRNQERVVIATKFDQPMAVFDGWVRLDVSMTGSKATVHESALVPVQIAIPLTELPGSRIHDAVLPPSFDRKHPTGFIPGPRPPVPDLNTGGLLQEPDVIKPPPISGRSTMLVSGLARLAGLSGHAGLVGPSVVVGPAARSNRTDVRRDDVAPIPELPPMKWDPPAPTTKPSPPSHASNDTWHPSDMLIGVDPVSGLLEAIRHDLAPVLGSSADRAMTDVADRYGPQVLQARLTHESGTEWTHEIPVDKGAGKIVVRVRPVREPGAEYVGSSKKFETDISTEGQSSRAYIRDSVVRKVLGGRVQIPIPHGSVSVNITNSSSNRPRVSEATDGVDRAGQLTDTNNEGTTGESEDRVPIRVKTTEAHNLFRQPIRFDISYEVHGSAHLLSNPPPAEPAPVRLNAVFAYPQNAPVAGPAPSGKNLTIHLDQVVLQVRPHVEALPQGPNQAGAPAAPNQDVASLRATPGEDAVAAHILNGMSDAGQAVFRKEWPKVRAELATHLKTMQVQRQLGAMSRGLPHTVNLTSVKGGKVVLSGTVKSMSQTDSDATSEFYSGGQRIQTSGISRTEASNWQAYVQVQADALQNQDALNLSVLGRVEVATGKETLNSRTESTSTGLLFRKKGPSISHTGIATVKAEMTRPQGLFGLSESLSRTGSAEVEFTTREAGPDKQTADSLAPLPGLVRPVGDPGPDGLSRGSIVRAITDGDDFRATVKTRLRELLSMRRVEDLGVQLDSSLTDVRLQRDLPAMTRGEQVEVFRHGKMRFMGSAVVRKLDFKTTEHEGGNANVLNEVNQQRARQPVKAIEGGARILMGPRWKIPGFQGSLMAGGGLNGRHRSGFSMSQTAKVSANSKFPRDYAIFDGETDIFLTVIDGDSRHVLPPIPVHGRVLIPVSETKPVESTKPDDTEQPEHTEQPEPLKQPAEDTESKGMKVAEGGPNKPTLPQKPTSPQKPTPPVKKAMPLDTGTPPMPIIIEDEAESHVLDLARHTVPEPGRKPVAPLAPQQPPVLRSAANHDSGSSRQTEAASPHVLRVQGPTEDQRIPAALTTVRTMGAGHDLVGSVAAEIVSVGRGSGALVIPAYSSGVEVHPLHAVNYDGGVRWFDANTHEETAPPTDAGSLDILVLDHTGHQPGSAQQPFPGLRAQLNQSLAHNELEPPVETSHQADEPPDLPDGWLARLHEAAGAGQVSHKGKGQATGLAAAWHKFTKAHNDHQTVLATHADDQGGAATRLVSARSDLTRLGIDNPDVLLPEYHIALGGNGGHGIPIIQTDALESDLIPTPADPPPATGRDMWESVRPEGITVTDIVNILGGDDLVAPPGPVNPDGDPSTVSARGQRLGLAESSPDLDARFGNVVQPKKVKGEERDDQGDVRLNPLWYPLENFKPALLDRAGVWLYAVDEDGQIFLGSEGVWAMASDEERLALLEGMRKHDPDLTLEGLKSAIDDQGVPTVAAGFGGTGAARVRPARVGGELFKNPVTGQWEIDASSRYMGPKVRPGVAPGMVTRWVENAAEQMSAVLKIKVKAQGADHARISHGAFVAGTGSPALDHEFGPLAGPKKVKEREFDDQGEVRLNPLWYRLDDFKPALLDRGGVWHFAVDEDGHILIGSDQLLEIAEEGELDGLHQSMQQKDPGLTLEQLKKHLDNQGHPTVAAGFDEAGRTRVRPARISGELSYQATSGRWEVTDKSGRYMSNKIRPVIDPREAHSWLSHVAREMSKKLGVAVVPLLFKNAEEPAPQPPPAVGDPDPAPAEATRVPPAIPVDGRILIPPSGTKPVVSTRPEHTEQPRPPKSPEVTEAKPGDGEGAPSQGDSPPAPVDLGGGHGKVETVAMPNIAVHVDEPNIAVHVDEPPAHPDSAAPVDVVRPPHPGALPGNSADDVFLVLTGGRPGVDQESPQDADFSGDTAGTQSGVR